MKAKLNAATIVIFGATGDLASRKLFPAILALARKNILPRDFKLIGFARRDLSQKTFQAMIKKSLKGKKLDSKIKAIIKNSEYVKGDFSNLEDYIALSQKLKEIDEQNGVCSNKLLYLATPPNYYDGIFDNLAESRLKELCSPDWTRILVEKPFGRNIKTAQALDRKLAKIFKEKQIFRIDHYLAKETIQNILTFRFSNSIFEPIWNKNYIEKIEIKLMEKLDVGTRGSFYDQVGALRDVGQNHILQMLALVAMEPPRSIEANDIREERQKVLNSLENIGKKGVQKNCTRGQYAGYQKSKGVRKGSQTETYFKIKASINNKRWKGAPFYLESGKAWGEDKIEIAVYFKEAINCFCPKAHANHAHENVLVFKIKPLQKIEIRFWAKRPGLEFEIEPKDFSFEYAQKEKHDAYEKVFYDAISADQTLFVSSAEIEASWRFINSISDNWDSLPLVKYKKGVTNIN